MSSPDFIREYKAKDNPGSASFRDEAQMSGTTAFRRMMKKAHAVFPPQLRVRP